jgi:hypothetical protein
VLFFIFCLFLVVGAEEVELMDDLDDEEELERMDISLSGCA